MQERKMTTRECLTQYGEVKPSWIVLFANEGERGRTKSGRRPIERHRIWGRARRDGKLCSGNLLHTGGNLLGGQRSSLR